MPNIRILLSLSALASGLAAQSLVSQFGNAVHAVGDPVASLPGTTIQASTNFSTPVMDQNGTLLYQARLTGGGVTGADDRAYFLGRGADRQLVLRAGDQAPGCAAGTLLRGSSATSGGAGLSSSPLITPFGEIMVFRSVLFDSTLSGLTPTTADSALFWGPAGGFTLMAREGDPVPGLPGVNFGETQSTLGSQLYRINNATTVVFLTPLTGAVTTADDLALFAGTPGNLVKVVREGDLFGTDVVTTISQFTTTSLGAFQLNEAGQVLHTVRFTAATPASSDQAVVIWTGGVNQILLREGDAAPGTVGAIFGNAGNTWSPSPSTTNFTNAGKTLIRTELVNGDVVAGVNDTAIYLLSASGHELIVRRGDAVPGVPGATFNFFSSTGHHLTNSDDVLFHSTVTGMTGGDSGVFVLKSGALTSLALEGQPLTSLAGAPSLAGGPWSVGDMNPSGPNFLRMNDRGQVAGQLEVTNGTTTKTVWVAFDDATGFRILIDGSESFTTSLGSAVPTSFSNGGATPSSDGGLSWFNNSGDIVLKPTLPAPVNGLVLRARVGSLQTATVAIDSATGGSQNFAFDCGAARAFNIYALVGSSSGTRPGFLSPLGPQTIPLNLDAWTQLSLDLSNTAIYSNTLALLDANGRGTASFNLPALPTFAGIDLHHAVVALDFSLVSTFVTEPVALRLF